MSEVTLHLGDCLEYMRSMPDKSVDAVITDPPYGIDYQSAWRTDKTQWKPKIANDKEPFLAWLPDAFRVLRNDGCLLCFCRWDVEWAFEQSIRNCGFDLKSQVIWDKVVHGMGDLSGAFAPVHENILFATKGEFKFMSGRPKSIIRQQRVDATKLVHPNEKPTPLLVRLIADVSVQEDVVFDPFMGSGSVGVASHETKRDFIGCEIDPGYFAIAEKRIEEAQMQTVMELA